MLIRLQGEILKKDANRRQHYIAAGRAVSSWQSPCTSGRLENSHNRRCQREHRVVVNSRPLNPVGPGTESQPHHLLAVWS